MPAYLPAFFILTTLATAAFFFYIIINAAGRSRLRYIVPGIVSFWLILQASLSNAGFYEVTNVLPPRIFAFGALPGLLAAIAFCVFLRKDLVDQLPLQALTLLHIVRLPVEITLYFLYEAKLIPEAMTFEGRNLDILSGLTAPLIYYLAFRNGRTNRPLLIAWNAVTILLLANVVAIAVLSFPSPLQSIALDQPNRAVAYFPFVWLPTVIVPVVFFAHLAAFIKLFRTDSQ